MSKRFDKIKRLKRENDFLQKGIEAREDAYDTVCKEKMRQTEITKQLTYLFILLYSLDKLTSNDFSQMARTIQKASNNFKADLAEGMLHLPNINLTEIINKTPYDEQL